MMKIKYIDRNLCLRFILNPPQPPSIEREFIMFTNVKILINFYMKRVKIYIHRTSSPLIKPVNDS